MGKIDIVKTRVGEPDETGTVRYGWCEICEGWVKEGYEYCLVYETKTSFEAFLLCEEHFEELFERMKKALEEKEVL